jgi:hypothetical protein
MSHFYGTLQGARGPATRCGTKKSGVTATAASWAGAVRTQFYINDQGEDCYIVEQIQWRGAGVYKVIATGVVGK